MKIDMSEPLVSPLSEMELIFRSGARVTIVGNFTFANGTWSIQSKGYPKITIFDPNEVVAIITWHNLSDKAA